MQHLPFASAALVMALQPSQAVITGSVRNETTNQPIAGLMVGLTDLDRTAITDSLGRYVFRNVAAGPHHVGVRHFGYSPHTLHALVPSSGTLEINVLMVPVEQRLATFVVRHAVPLGSLSNDQSEQSNTRRLISAIRNDPMNTESDALLSLVGGTVSARPEAPSGLNVRGGAADQVAYTLDGIPVFNPFHVAGLFSSWNPDALAAVDLSTDVRDAGNTSALSGTVNAVTRSPAAQFKSQGSFSTTHARLTVDGPIGRRDAGFLLSMRAGFPGIIAPRRENSYVRGEWGDHIAKLETPAFNGRLKLLSYSSEDETSTPATVSDTVVTRENAGRNMFAWSGHSVGAEYTRAMGHAQLRAVGWSATSDASSAWTAADGPVTMSSSRRNRGALVSATFNSSRSKTLAGFRAEQMATTYALDFAPNVASNLRMNSRTGLATGFLQNERVVGRVTLLAGASLAAFAHRLHANPFAEARLRANEQFSVSGSYTHRNQYAQSMRNGENVTGIVFPAELFVSAARNGVPVATSDLGVFGAEFNKSGALRAAVQLHAQRLQNVVVIAPFDGEPFATRTAGLGHGRTHGLSLDIAFSQARYGVVANYGFQQVQYTSGEVSYMPSHGAKHAFGSGVILFPTPTASIRIGVTALGGRRTTAVASAFEWEACNLKDRGCEFSGSPRSSVQSPGGLSLPLYVRADVGVRKHWHLQARGRSVEIALFGAFTNVLGRGNVLTFAPDAVSGAMTPISMRPQAPLVLGLDWHY